MTLTIVADDLTGACDSGAVFCGRGRVAVFVAPALPSDRWETAAIDTRSRSLAPGEAARRVRDLGPALARRLGEGLAFKKIDSTLRGPIGAEIEALLLAAGRTTALLCPAFPAQGRAVRDGVLEVDGVPAHRSPVGHDPDYPGATSEVTRILAAQTARPLRRLPLRQVRASTDALAAALADADGAIAVADAETDADLDALAAAALARPAVLLAGSAGLARAVSARLGAVGERPALPSGRAWLIVAGSLHAATRAQLEALEGARVAVRWVEGNGTWSGPGPVIAELHAGRPAVVASRPAGAPEARLAVAERLGAVAAAVVAAATPDLICATGGETAGALLRALGASHVELTGAPLDGLAAGEIIVPDGPTAGRRPLLAKAGGFGAPDLFLRLLARSAA